MAERMHQYEMVVIAAPDLDEQGLQTLSDRITNWISVAGGTVSNTNIWGRRRLAYAIRKQTDGIYVQYNFQMEPTGSRELDRNLRIDEQVIRHLTIRLDED
jgi:small subunit ribosomal protein S6